MRIVLGLEYDGTRYHGYQFQQNLSTIQGVLEQALSKVADHPVSSICAGRTDRGVHAKGQVVHFDTNSSRPQKAWVLGTNSYLPPDIRVHWAKEIDETFHARFSATSRSYQYIIENQPTRSALKRHYVTWHPIPLNEVNMQKAAQYLIGEHDFNAFRSSRCQASTATRSIYELEINRIDQYIVINIRANAFLHHMVRNIVGVLTEIGSGKKEPKWCQDVLISKNRQWIFEKMPPMGLCLIKVTYPIHKLYE
jgi:tRNA pseudouridine38-40 synthase